ncbi:MAG: DNA recombination protein RmuC [Lentisphaeria bacterium]|nr:DNA recombination protein RmuC [Lentisphaeria bacterium]
MFTFICIASGIFLCAAVLFGAAFFHMRSKYASLLSATRPLEDFNGLEEEKKQLQEALHGRELDLARTEKELENAKNNARNERESLLSAHAKELAVAERNLEEKLKMERESASRILEETKKTSEAEKNALHAAMDTMKKTYEEAKEELEKRFQGRAELLKEEFKGLSEKILAENASSLQNSNKEQWENLLAPLNEKMLLFRKEVEESREKGVELHSALRTELSKMAEETRKIGLDADNLAKALKGEQKTQGNFGEFLLEDLLSRSGLVKGVHYECQETLRDNAGNAVVNEQNRKMRPDVIIHYPDGKDLILDSKVSLTAYVDYMNAETEEARKNALARHIQSVRKHVEELSEKNYSSYLRLAERETIDFVIMFIPNEGPFRLAMTEAPSLWEEAFRKKVMIISPTNLIALLRLIHIAWTREEQTRNQKEILETATMLLDRLYAFYKELNDVGNDLEKTMDTYRKAVNRLKGEGKGTRSVVKAAERLVRLGVKKSKEQRLPDRLIPGDTPLALEEASSEVSPDENGESLFSGEASSSGTDSP